MTLSIQTFHNLAFALKSEVIEFIYEDDRYVEMMNEMISDAIKEKLGPVDPMVEAQLSFCIFDLIILQ
jgi:hypothetical protein